MKLQIKSESIDLSDHHLGLDFPAIEAAVRSLAEDFIKGVLEENMNLELQKDEETGDAYIVLWAGLKPGLDDAVAYVPVQKLFDEYLQKQQTIPPNF